LEDTNVNVPKSLIPLPNRDTDPNCTSPSTTPEKAPEKLFIVPDLNSDGFDIWNFHGQAIHGTPVVVEKRVHTDSGQEAICEVCDAPRENVYRLADENAPGVTVCLDHLNDSVWVDEVHTTWRTLMFSETALLPHTELGEDIAPSEL
jgi:hypothetical protein